MYADHEMISESDDEMPRGAAETAKRSEARTPAQDSVDVHMHGPGPASASERRQGADPAGRELLHGSSIEAQAQSARNGGSASVGLGLGEEVQAGGGDGGGGSAKSFSFGTAGHLCRPGVAAAGGAAEGFELDPDLLADESESRELDVLADFRPGAPCTAGIRVLGRGPGPTHAGLALAPAAAAAQCLAPAPPLPLPLDAMDVGEDCPPLFPASLSRGPTAVGPSQSSGGGSSAQGLSPGPGAAAGTAAAGGSAGGSGASHVHAAASPGTAHAGQNPLQLQLHPEPCHSPIRALERLEAFARLHEMLAKLCLLDRLIRDRVYGEAEGGGGLELGLEDLGGRAPSPGVQQSTAQLGMR